MDRGAALVSVGVVTPLLVAWMVIPDADAAAGFLDLMRSLVAASPFVGSFFRSPDVVSRPVTRRDLWRAQWLVATVGVTAAVFVLRLIAGVFQGNLQTPVLAQSAVADLIGTVVSAGVASALFNFNKPPAFRTLPAAVIMFVVAMAAVLGAVVVAVSARRCRYRRSVTSLVRHRRGESRADRRACCSVVAGPGAARRHSVVRLGGVPLTPRPRAGVPAVDDVQGRRSLALDRSQTALRRAGWAGDGPGCGGYRVADGGS